jgi:hypothetical protein
MADRVVQTRLPQPDPLSWTYVVAPASPMVWHVISESACRDLIDHWRREHEAGRGLPSAFDKSDVPPAELVPTPAESASAVTDLLADIADHLGLPFAVSSAQAVVARYRVGAGTEWHTDAEPGKKRSDRRTVSFTLLLNSEFDGGYLETDPGGPVEMAAGDVCGFTSRTWHRVAPVRSGERFALIAFGGFGEAS